MKRSTKKHEKLTEKFQVHDNVSTGTRERGQHNVAQTSTLNAESDSLVRVLWKIVCESTKN